MPTSQRPRHRHNRKKTAQAPMHLPPHPVHAWRTFEPIYGLLDQLQTGIIDSVQGKPVMRAWESNELVEVGVMTNEPLLLLSEAAELLHVSEDHLASLARAGNVPAAKPGRRWVFKRSWPETD